MSPVKFRNVNTGKVVIVRHDREAARMDKLPHYERADKPKRRRREPVIEAPEDE